MKKKYYSITLIMLFVFILSSISMAAEFTLTYGGINAPDNAIEQIVGHYFDLIEERSDGRIEVKRYFSCSLGSAREIAESVKNGVIDFLWGGSGDLSVYAPVVEILTNTPYLYKSPEHGERVLREVWPTVEEMLVKKGFMPLFPAYQGTRQILSKKPIKSFADMQKLRKRTVETPFFTGMYRAMGADPIPIAFNEAYTALQTGVVEAVGGTVLTICDKKWYEQAKELSLTNTILVYGIMTISRNTYQNLPEDLQTILVETAWEIVPWANNLAKEQELERLEKLKSEGVNVYKIDDLEPFRNAVKGFVTDYAANLGSDVKELYQRMLEIQ